MGDTLSLVAQSVGVDLVDLMAVNGLTDPNLVEVGQVLVIPAPAPTPTIPPMPTLTPTPLPGPVALPADVPGAGSWTLSFTPGGRYTGVPYLATAAAAKPPPPL